MRKRESLLQKREVGNRISILASVLSTVSCSQALEITARSDQCGQDFRVAFAIDKEFSLGPFSSTILIN
jgi:hypothetical protein